MKQNEIRRIMNHVLMNFSCPKCESRLHQGEVDVSLTTVLGVAFSIKCPECRSLININGYIPQKKNLIKKIKTKINPQNLKKAVKKIQEFRGKNISDLFQ